MAEALLNIIPHFSSTVSICIYIFLYSLFFILLLGIHLAFKEMKKFEVKR